MIVLALISFAALTAPTAQEGQSHFGDSPLGSPQAAPEPQPAAKPLTPSPSVLPPDRIPAPDTPPAAASVLPANFDALVARTMKTFEVPGMAVAVVKDGQVVLAKGFGVRRLGEAAPVDARTLFGIASNTKAFTATALGLLVEEGKIEWDGQVTRYHALVPDVGPVCHPRDDRPRSPRPQERPRARRGRPAALAADRPTRGERSSAASATSPWPPRSAAPTPTTTCSTSPRASSSRTSAA